MRKSFTTKLVKCVGQEWLVASDEATARLTNWGKGSIGDASAFVSAVNADPALNHGFQWRLPTLYELKATIGKKNAPAEGWFWSSSPYEGDSDFAWYVDFYNGYVNYSYRNSFTRVRLVRAS